MSIRKGLILCLLLCLCAAARGEGVTLRTVTCFGGTDPAAEAYQGILRDYEESTGNRVSDSSSPSDESWKKNVLRDFAVGNEPDLLFFFAAGGDSAPILSRVVPIRTINEAYPDLNLPEIRALEEADGLVYAIPAHGFWEGVYLRTDLFEQYHAPMPDTWEALLEDIRIFRENGIVPIAVSLSDIPHYLAEMVLLSCASAGEQQARPVSFDQVPASWIRAMEVIRELYLAGAFSDDALTANDTGMLDLFTSGGAAMRIDGSWMAESLSPDLMNKLRAVPMPLRETAGPQTNCIGGMSMGFYLTRKAWNSQVKRDAAVDLLSWLTRDENLVQLANSSVTGKLLESVQEMEERCSLLSPLQDAMNQDARECWLLECIPAVAEGTLSPEECWRKVMEHKPFGE